MCENDKSIRTQKTLLSIQYNDDLTKIRIDLPVGAHSPLIRPCTAPYRTNAGMAGALGCGIYQDTRNKSTAAQIVPFLFTIFLDEK